MKNISFTVPGEPRGKARPRVTRTKAGKSLTYTPDKTVAYEELVRQRYLQAAGGLRFADGVPLALFVRAFYGIPKSTSKRKRAEIEAGAYWAMKKPDFDNILKIVSDALIGIAYADDVQVVKSSVSKIYTPCDPHVEVSIHAMQAGGCDT